MTERLYLSQPYLVGFEAEVTGERRLHDRRALVLSRTAFYPEGGGQPADRGALGGARVVDVQEVDGEVLHAVEGEVQGNPVAGQIDWARRQDHMQQHHGQHLLSATFEAALGAVTLSFHLGEDRSTIDLDVPADRLKPARLAEIEQAVNALIFQDLAVETRELSKEELERLPLRKDPVKGSRVVMVRDRSGALVDASPCGGTHPQRTGEVGALAILRAVKWGAGARVEFLCGGRVLSFLRQSSEALSEVAAALRCAPKEVPAAARRMGEELVLDRKELRTLLVALSLAEATRLAGKPDPIVEELALPGGDAPSYLRSVGQALAARGRLALLGARAEGRAFLCFARGPDPRGADLSGLLREAAAVLGGKGGGTVELSQGSGPEGEKLPEALELARGRLAAKGPAS
ncbi:MAG TPA: DHHA1 domain-containing protein [Anaeromyxobacteraceae bacterium]|nr:DHHA1 domain-containing protein [Anaeromyxobacteraceae bacterium]